MNNFLIFLIVLIVYQNKLFVLIVYIIYFVLVQYLLPINMNVRLNVLMYGLMNVRLNDDLIVRVNVLMRGLMIVHLIVRFPFVLLVLLVFVQVYFGFLMDYLV